jgi:hypothetical protein
VEGVLRELRVRHGARTRSANTGSLRVPNASRPVYSGSMADDKVDTVLKGTMRDLAVASGRIRAARHLLREHALEDDPGYLPLVARLSEALDLTEAALREARRLRDAAG